MSDASAFEESYGIHTLPQARACISRDDATRRDTAYGGMLPWPVSSIQGPVLPREPPSSLSLNRASRKIYLETVTIIRAVADAARRDGCESFCVERIVSRPFHGRSARSSKFFSDSADATRGKPS